MSRTMVLETALGPYTQTTVVYRVPLEKIVFIKICHYGLIGDDFKIKHQIY